MGAGDIISPGNQILALTAKKAIPKSETIAKGKIFVLIKLKDLRLFNTIITCLRDFKKFLLDNIIYFLHFVLADHMQHFYLDLCFFAYLQRYHCLQV